MYISNNYQPLDQFDIFILDINFYSSKLDIFLNDLLYYSTDNYSYIFNPLIDLFNNDITNSFLYSCFLIIQLKFLVKNILRFFNSVNIVYISLWQFIYEMLYYKFTLTIIKLQAGKKGQDLYVYIFLIFITILFANSIGLIPNSFTLTSHIMFTFFYGFSILLGLTFLGFYEQSYKFLNLFIPKGVPKYLLPLLIFIEFLSYIARGLSLSIRLFANLMSGHSLIHILLFFIIQIIRINYLIGLISLNIMLVIFTLEIGIAFLQAYVFLVLFSIYLKDSYEVGH